MKKFRFSTEFDLCQRMIHAGSLGALKEYMDHLGVMEVYEPVGGVFGDTEGYAIYPVIGERTHTRYVIGDTDELGCAAYLWKAASPENPDLLTAWLAPATMSKPQARAHALYERKFHHKWSDLNLPDGAEPAHIRNIRRWLATH